MRLNILDKPSIIFSLVIFLAQVAPVFAQAGKSQLLQPEAPQYAPVSDIAPTQTQPPQQMQYQQPPYQNQAPPQYQQQPYQNQPPPQYQQQPYQNQMQPPQQYQQQPYPNQAPVYREQYSGNYMQPPQGQGQYQGGAQSGYYPPMYQTPNMPQAPAGQTLNVTLQTAISTQIARQGDLVQGVINQNINLGNGGFIPAGTMVTGTVTDSIAGRRLSRSGLLSISFNAIRLPTGQSIPINAHLVGDLGKYSNKGSGQNDVYRGEGWGAKAGQTLIRGGAGAGLGAALGTGVGAIAGGGHGAGMGAWSGAAIGGGIGVADMLLRKGKDVLIPAGTSIQIQLDAPVGVPGGSV
ncbi:TrbI/VirB10 family protein [bacterium]|nr:TrbI/VirB10 family protein [bacterium]QQR59121.1 MAG: TrbI/VirB10 family protein [Candidatus Melainabacteria bacterium]